jgi:hypothetical protein
LFRKRSEYFSSFEQFLLDTPGASERDIAACRAKADIIVTSGTPLAGEKGGSGRPRTFQDLQLALGKHDRSFVHFMCSKITSTIMYHVHCTQGVDGFYKNKRKKRILIND